MAHLRRLQGLPAQAARAPRREVREGTDLRRCTVGLAIGSGLPIGATQGSTVCPVSSDGGYRPYPISRCCRRVSCRT